MKEFLINFGGISLTMSLLILLGVILRRPMKKHVTAGCRYLIWTIVIIRLCIPVSFGFIPDIITLSDTPTEQGEAAAPLPVAPQAPDENKIAPDGSYVQTVEPHGNGENTEVKNHPVFTLNEEQILLILFFVWLVGAVSFSLINLIRYWSNSRILNRNLSVPDSEMIDIYDRICDREGLKRRPDLYISTIVKSPMVYGFIRPKVILPDMVMSDDNIDCILRHEVVHYMRKDLYIKLLALIANSIHWFNPTAYIACSILAAETELSCDESALELLTMKQRLNYGASMLEIVKHCKGTPVLTTGFNPKKKAVKERFENIVDVHRRSKGYILVVLAIVLAFLAGSMVGYAVTPEPQLSEIVTDRSDSENTADTFDRIYYTVEGSDSWKLYYDTDRLVLGNKDGRCFEYTDIRGTAGDSYSLQFYPTGDKKAYCTVLDNYAAIVYDVPQFTIDDEIRQGVIVIELSTGRIIARQVVDSTDLLELHGLAEDTLAGYESTAGYSPAYGITVECYGDDSINKLHFNYTLETNDGWYKMSAINRFEPNSEALTKLVAAMGIDPFEVNSITDIKDIGKMKNIDSTAAETVAAFINKDIAKLNELGGYSDYSDYLTLEFGEYTVSRRGEVGLRLDIEILSSGIEGIEPGRHAFVYQSFHNSSMEHVCGHYSHIDGGEAERMLDNWFMVSTDPIMPYKNANAEEKARVFDYLVYKYGELSPEEYSVKAEKIFGITDLNVSVYTEYESDPIVVDGDIIYAPGETGRGGVVYFYDIIDSEQIGTSYTITVRFYADTAKTLIAKDIKYSFEMIDSDLTLAKANEVLTDTGRGVVMLIM